MWLTSRVGPGPATPRPAAAVDQRFWFSALVLPLQGCQPLLPVPGFAELGAGRRGLSEGNNYGSSAGGSRRHRHQRRPGGLQTLPVRQAGQQQCGASVLWVSATRRESDNPDTPSRSSIFSRLF